MITTVVVARTSFSDGVVTLRISLRTSRKKFDMLFHFPPIPPPPLPPGAGTAAVFAIFLLILLCTSDSALLACTSGRWPPAIHSGRGGGIRTPKSGFGDRQFNR